MLNNSEDNMYGEVWKKGQTLIYLLLHQTHHRGQMTVLMRQAGLKVSGIYGPAKEEWEAMGMPALEWKQWECLHWNKKFKIKNLIK